MKKLLATLLLGLSTLTFAWGEAPSYEIKKERGQRVVYENNRPAKGTITWSTYDGNYDEVIVSEFNVKNGLLAGDFTLYDLNNIPAIVGVGKVKDGIFNGTITIDDQKTGDHMVAKGTFKLTNDIALDNDGTNDTLGDLVGRIIMSAVNARFNGDMEFTMENGEIVSNMVTFWKGTTTPKTIKSFINGSDTYFRKDGTRELIELGEIFFEFDENEEFIRAGVVHEWSYRPARDGKPAEYSRCTEETINKYIMPLYDAVVNNKPVPKVK